MTQDIAKELADALRLAHEHLVSSFRDKREEYASMKKVFPIIQAALSKYDSLPSVSVNKQHHKLVKQIEEIIIKRYTYPILDRDKAALNTTMKYIAAAIAAIHEINQKKEG